MLCVQPKTQRFVAHHNLLLEPHHIVDSKPFPIRSPSSLSLVIRGQSWTDREFIKTVWVRMEKSNGTNQLTLDEEDEKLYQTASSLGMDAVTIYKLALKQADRLDGSIVRDVEDDEDKGKNPVSLDHTIKRIRKESLSTEKNKPLNYENENSDDSDVEYDENDVEDERAAAVELFEIAIAQFENELSFLKIDNVQPDKNNFIRQKEYYLTDKSDKQTLFKCYLYSRCLFDFGKFVPYVEYLKYSWWNSRSLAKKIKEENLQDIIGPELWSKMIILWIQSYFEYLHIILIEEETHLNHAKEEYNDFEIKKYSDNILSIVKKFEKRLSIIEESIEDLMKVLYRAPDIVVKGLIILIPLISTIASMIRRYSNEDTCKLVDKFKWALDLLSEYPDIVELDASGELNPIRVLGGELILIKAETLAESSNELKHLEAVPLAGKALGLVEAPMMGSIDLTIKQFQSFYEKQMSLSKKIKSLESGNSPSSTHSQEGKKRKASFEEEESSDEQDVLIDRSTGINRPNVVEAIFSEYGAADRLKEDSLRVQARAHMLLSVLVPTDAIAEQHFAKGRKLFEQLHLLCPDDEEIAEKIEEFKIMDE